VEERGDGAAQPRSRGGQRGEEERGDGQHEQEVLEHVRAEEVARGEQGERRGEGEDQERDRGAERGGAARGAEPARRTVVGERGDARDERGEREGPGGEQLSCRHGTTLR
jgi:hypothetical protein